MISVIIPTRNRPELLFRLVNVLETILDTNYEITIVDSSDSDKCFPERYNRSKIKYHLTNVRSAAAQRNIGLELSGVSMYTFFLDDDVLPNPDYFKRSISALVETKSIGVSGVAKNSQKSVVREMPKGLSGLFHRVFLLDSNCDGVVLRSGINIPVRSQSLKRIKTEWLIGCSGWQTEKLGATRFESDFQGQSLAEDVIFSVKMRKFGELVTDTSIVLEHEESEIERPGGREFWKMWIENRHRLVHVLRSDRRNHFAYWWANLGQVIILAYAKIRRKNYKQGSFLGILEGVISIIKGNA
jgi:glycosyltransferase involved in cell wall biosynthesis